MAHVFHQSHLKQQAQEDRYHKQSAGINHSFTAGFDSSISAVNMEFESVEDPPTSPQVRTPPLAYLVNDKQYNHSLVDDTGQGALASAASTCEYYMLSDEHG